MEPSSAKLAAYRRKLSTKRNNKEEGKKPDEKLQTKNCGDEKLCKTRVRAESAKSSEIFTQKCFYVCFLVQSGPTLNHETTTWG
jgi:hypothetical protein